MSRATDAEKRSKRGQTVVKPRSNSGQIVQTVVKLWSIVVKSWSNSGQTVVTCRIGSDHDQIVFRKNQAFEPPPLTSRLSAVWLLQIRWNA